MSLMLMMMLSSDVAVPSRVHLRHGQGLRRPLHQLLLPQAARNFASSTGLHQRRGSRSSPPSKGRCWSRRRQRSGRRSNGRRGGRGGKSTDRWERPRSVRRRPGRADGGGDAKPQLFSTSAGARWLVSERQHNGQNRSTRQRRFTCYGASTPSLQL